MNNDPVPADEAHTSGDDDLGTVPKVPSHKDWWKPCNDVERPATPEPVWVIPTSHIPDVVNNWANALATTNPKGWGRLCSASLESMIRFHMNIRVIPKYHSEDGNPARANIKQALSRYEHVGPQDTRPQEGERSQDYDQRLDLADDLKKAQDHISSTNTSHKTKITTSNLVFLIQSAIGNILPLSFVSPYSRFADWNKFYRKINVSTSMNAEKGVVYGKNDVNRLNSSQHFTYAKVVTPNFVKNKVDSRSLEYEVGDVDADLIIPMTQAKRRTFWSLNDDISRLLISDSICRIQQRRYSVSAPGLHKKTRAASEWFKKDYIGSVTTWEYLVEKFVQKFYQLYDNNKEMEADEDDNPGDIADIFKIEGNLFDFETPLCKAFNEFNYLLRIDTDLFAFNISEIKTYEEYELNNNMMGDLEEPWSDNGNHKWYDELADGKLKEEALTHKAKFEESWGDATPEVMKFCAWNYRTNNAGDTQDSQEHKKEHKGNEHTLSSKPTHDPSVCHVRRFEMIKHPFDANDEYVAIKEHEHFDHSRTNIDACQAYRELFRIMDEGWLMTKDLAVKNRLIGDGIL
ncbi:hypothetical protein Tco_1509554 [Tanacetum coccineum]